MAEMIEALAVRARGFALASRLASYPDEELGQTLAELSATEPEHEGAAALARAAGGPRGLDDIRSAFIELFDGGDGHVSLYETEYGRMRGMSKGNDLADIAGFYQAFGLTLDQDRVHEMLDHIAVELEFYAVLLLKQGHLAELGDDEGVAVVEDARRKFLADHLGRIARAIAAQPRVRDDALYGGVFAWCGRIVEQECASLGVVPAPLDFFPDKEAKLDMKCGTVHLPVMP